MLSTRENFYATPNNIRTQWKRRKKIVNSATFVPISFPFLCNDSKHCWNSVQPPKTKSSKHSNQVCDEADLVNFFQFATAVLAAIHEFCSSLLRNSVCYEIPPCNSKKVIIIRPLSERNCKRILPLSIPLFVLQISYYCICVVHVA